MARKRRHKHKSYTLKKALSALFIMVALIVIGFLMLPRYAQRILFLRQPTATDFTNFNNKIIHTGIPAPWKTNEQTPLTEEEVAYLRSGQTFAYLVIKDNQLLKAYYGSNADKNSRMNSYAMVQGLISLLVGCAIEEGYLNGIDDRLSDYFPEFYREREPPITLRQLLTMSSGLVPAKQSFDRLPFSLKAYYATNLKQLILNLHTESGPGQSWSYSTADTQLIAMVLERATRQPLEQYCQKAIWHPIGAERPALWSTDDKGTIKAFCCFYATASDWARIGQLILNNGRWGKNQLIGANYIAQLQQAQLNLTTSNGTPVNFWGLHWWITNYNNKKVIYARGQHGQYLAVIPEENMVMVRLGDIGETDANQSSPPELGRLLRIAHRLAGEIL